MRISLPARSPGCGTSVATASSQSSNASPRASRTRSGTRRRGRGRWSSGAPNVPDAPARRTSRGCARSRPPRTSEFSGDGGSVAASRIEDDGAEVYALVDRIHPLEDVRLDIAEGRFGLADDTVRERLDNAFLEA